MKGSKAGSWMEDFMDSQERRKAGHGSAAGDIPPGPPLDQRTDMDRPAYWYTDLSTYPNARFNLYYVMEKPHPSQQLQLLYPEKFEPGKDEPLPVLMYVHGGGFLAGNTMDNGRKALYTVEASLYALNHGYAVAVADYRLRPEFEIMSAIYDVKAAIRFLRANAADLGLDGDQIALMGESAGGYLVNIAGVTCNHPDFEDKTIGNGHCSTTVSAVISWYSSHIVDPDGRIDRFYNDAETRFSPEIRIALARFLSPKTYIGRFTPPFFLQHGMEDTTSDYHRSQEFFEELCAATGMERNRLELVPGAEHAVRWFITPENGNKIALWLDQYTK